MRSNGLLVEILKMKREAVVMIDCEYMCYPETYLVILLASQQDCFLRLHFKEIIRKLNLQYTAYLYHFHSFNLMCRILIFSSRYLFISCSCMYINQLLINLFLNMMKLFRDEMTLSLTRNLKLK